MNEKPFFFERGDVRLFGLLHAPTHPSRSAFVLSHPFGEEKLWSHRVYVSLARALSDHGYFVFRFDYMGAGDSTGTSGEASLETHLADLRAAVETLLALQPRLERVGLMGLRLGATFAAIFCERAAAAGQYECLRNAPLILWDPVVDGHEYFQEILRSNLTMQLAAYGKVRESREALQAKILAGGTVSVDGYEMGKPLLSSCAIPALLSGEKKAHSGPTLTVQIAASDQVQDREHLVSLARSYPQGMFQRVMEQAFWREIKLFYGCAANLQDTTMRWLEQIRG